MPKNFLFVLDNCLKNCGANVNIGLLLADEICKRNNQVHAMVLNSDVDCHKIRIFDGYFVVTPLFAQYISTKQKKLSWTTITKKKKICALLLNPRFLLSYVLSRIVSYPFLCKKCFNKIKKKTSIDCVIGISFPFLTERIVSKFPSGVEKIIIQLDPYTTHYLLFSKKNLMKREERKVLKKIDYSLTASLHYEERIKEFPEFRKKIIKFELPLIRKIDFLQKKAEKNQNIIFSFSGYMYEDIRNPKFLLELFKKLPSNFILYLAGRGCEKLVESYKKVLGDKLFYFGSVSRERAFQIALDSDFLININNTIPNQIPSKLFEYICTGFPVINLCKLNDCPSLKYTAKYRNCLNIFEEDGICFAADKVMNFVETNMNVRVKYDEIYNLFKENSIDFSVNKILSLL